MGWWRRRRLSLAKEQAAGLTGEGCAIWRPVEGPALLSRVEARLLLDAMWVGGSLGREVRGEAPALGSPLAHRTASPPPVGHRLLPTFPSSITAPTLPHVLSACPRHTLIGHFHLRAFAQAVCSAWSVFPSNSSQTSRPAAGPLPRRLCHPAPQPSHSPEDLI